MRRGAIARGAEPSRALGEGRGRSRCARGRRVARPGREGCEREALRAARGAAAHVEMGERGTVPCVECRRRECRVRAMSGVPTPVCVSVRWLGVRAGRCASRAVPRVRASGEEGGGGWRAPPPRAPRRKYREDKEHRPLRHCREGRTRPSRRTRCARADDGSADPCPPFVPALGDLAGAFMHHGICSRCRAPFRPLCLPLPAVAPGALWAGAGRGAASLQRVATFELPDDAERGACSHQED